MAEFYVGNSPRGMIPAEPDPSRIYGRIALGSLVALGPELFIGFGLGFSPDWANDWLGGRLSIHEVWSAGMTTILFAILVTGAIGLGALIGLLLSRLRTGQRYVGIVFGIWLMAGALLALLVTPTVYRSIYASALEMWPNGYNPR